MSYQPVLTARVGKVDPTSLDDYKAHGGFQALERAVEIGRDAIIDIVTQANVLGRGGAAFPAGIKWKAVNEERAPKFVVANADESEPGTFKDRIIMEQDPFSLVEGMIIAGYATGAEQGYIYIRGEYARAIERVQHAVDACYQAGYLGRDILDTGYALEIEVRRGAGAYICGEETALFESIEGKRGFPRLKPPYPTQAGLFGRPTLINNVETLINALPLVLYGPDWYKRLGPVDSPGPKLYCLSGRVRRPGLVEAPMGTSLYELIYDYGGGVTGSGELGGVLLGGAAGMFVTPDYVDVYMDFATLNEVGAALGSGVVMVFDTSVDMKQVLKRIARFFAHESCGKCYPCQLGTQRQMEIVYRLAADRLRDGDMVLLKDVGQAMTEASICGLGQTAHSAIRTALDRFDFDPARERSLQEVLNHGWREFTRMRPGYLFLANLQKVLFLYFMVISTRN
ncbi:MAG: NADH-quinone oxidoreductase subunit NuoF [Chloroflexi bacterium]|nr:NADH-quinone oxidoreductase subunit NuoF [Chloroflexota bacterium]